jgi:hypothetical protein
MAQRDRTAALLASTTLNGIDYVEIASDDERTLRVHFLNAVRLAGTVSGTAITGGETIPEVPVGPIADATDWSVDAEGRPVLTLRARLAGDFSSYTLTLASTSLDPFFDHTVLSFKATCPADGDCLAPQPSCLPDREAPPPIDYLARDFLSFRQALSDFSAVRYPGWRERSEADVGIVVLEALAALADDLSYTQDRVAAEATLDTATQRRSIVRHARLVDYEPRPLTSARALLQLNVSAGPITPGAAVSARGPDGGVVVFETGTGLADTTTYSARPEWNGARDGAGGIQPYVWDDHARCLAAGSTGAWVRGHGLAFFEGQALLVDTAGATSADPPVRQVVHLAASRPGLGDHAVEEVDPLFLDGGVPSPVTHIRWRAEDALTAGHDLDRTTFAGNLVPAVQGRRFVEPFAIDQAPPGAPDTPLALVRTGPNSVGQYLHTLAAGRLTWLATDGLPLPEIALVQQPVPPATQIVPWTWRRSLLETDRFEQAFTTDPAAYHRIQANAGGSRSDDYDGDGGDTVRFGDGVFGEIPDPGAVFLVAYRVGDGARGNVPAEAITTLEPGAPQTILDVVNPFPAAGGAAEEPAERVRRLAPQAFRARQLRAVRPEDYEAAARTLPWVDRAGTVVRWTGSWLTVFTTADPTGSELLPPVRRTELVTLLNRYRMAGYESYVPDPLFASLDLVVTVCARPDAFGADVEEEVAAALGTGALRDGRPGFFAPAHFTFGTPLERSALEAAIQDAHGVAGVVELCYRRRGFTAGFVPVPEWVSVGAREIIRCDGDPSRPDAGLVQVFVEGGR